MFRIDPYIIMLLATVLVATVLPVRGDLVPVMDMIVDGAIALLFFLYGAKLSTKAVVDGFLHWRLQGLVLLSTFVLFPILGLILIRIFGAWVTPELSLGLMFLCLLPSTVQSSIAFTSIAGGNIPAAICAASVSNLLGIVITPALVGVMLSSHGAGFDMNAFRDIAMQLLLPFVLGQLCRPFIGKWLTSQKRLTSIVDRGSILLVVYSAFSAGMVAGVWWQLSWENFVVIAVFDVVILAVVMVITTYGSRKLGFSKADEIVIVFCGSKKSMASGIPMANILFAGQAVSMIVLPLMLFHQLQLFVCAALAQRYAQRRELQQLQATAQTKTA
jgi:sodium/bile acid cotransporter 7